MLKLLSLLFVFAWALPAHAALKFDYQSNSTAQSKYAAGLRTMARITSASALTLTSGPAGTFGGTYLDMTSAPNIGWPGLDNCPVGSSAISVLMRVVPNASGAPAALKGLLSLNSGTMDNNQGLRGGYGFVIRTDGKLGVTAGAIGSTGVGYFNNAAASAAFTFVNNTPTDIGFTWDGTSGATAKVYQDGVQIGTVTAAGASSAMNYLGCVEIQTYSPDNLATNNQFHINEIAIWDNVENFAAAPYVGRSGFVTSTAYEGYNFTSPAASNVLNGVAYGPGPGGSSGTYQGPSAANVKTGVAFGASGGSTGSYDGSDRWTDPGAAAVQAGVAYKANSLTNNQTGSYTGADRWTDPGAANVRSGTAYKANSTTNNQTGSLSVPSAANVLLGVAVDATTGTYVGVTTGNVKHGVAYGAASALTGSYTGADWCSDPGQANVLSTASYLVAGVSVSGSWLSAPVNKVQSGYAYGAAGVSLTGTDLCTDPSVANVTLGTGYDIYSVHKVGTYVPSGTIDPLPQNVRSGIGYALDGIVKVGTALMPPVNKVKLGYLYDDGATAGTLTCDDPGVGNVAAGINYSVYSVSKTGTLAAVTNYLSAAILKQGATTPSLTPLKITRGDTVIFTLYAQDATGAAFDLTGASLQTQIRGPGGVVKTFGNSQHTPDSDQVAHKGKFLLSLSASDTAALKQAAGLEIVTQATQGASATFFHGKAILTVLPSTPEDSE
jgi:hypothetical protein